MEEEYKKGPWLLEAALPVGELSFAGQWHYGKAISTLTRNDNLPYVRY
ncbi:hypothetical protein [Sabulibacter ruber]|nr:hypothetical protein [Sabulibacter ruber]